jgi:hypothetical protein
VVPSCGTQGSHDLAAGQSRCPFRVRRARQHSQRVGGCQVVEAGHGGGEELQQR